MHDEHLYFACGWVIRPNINFAQLKAYADDHEVALRLIAPLYVSEQGYTVLTFAAQVDDEPQLVEFIKKAGAEMGLTHWYGVPADYYATGTEFDIDKEAANVRVEWLKVMNAYGRRNDEIRKSLDEKQA